MNAYLIYHLGGIVSKEYRDSNLNSREIEEARNYFRFLGKGSQAYCGLNADDGRGCGKPLQRLEDEWIVLRKKRNLPLVRQKPLLIVNEKQGYGLHRFKDGKLEYCGNVNYYCYHCNRIEGKIKDDVKPDENSGYEIKKSKFVRPRFKKELELQVVRFGDVCKMAVVNKWSDEKYFCSQKLLENCINQLVDRKILIVDKDEWGFNCKYPLCNGDHIIHFEKHYQPIPALKDKDVADEEIRRENAIS